MSPLQLDHAIVTSRQVKLAHEGAVIIPEANQIEQRSNHGPIHLIFYLGLSVVAAVNVAADACALQQVHVIRTGQQTHIVDLWYAWSKELDRT
jgi:hypothetical protein